MSDEAGLASVAIVSVPITGIFGSAIGLIKSRWVETWAARRSVLLVFDFGPSAGGSLISAKGSADSMPWSVTVGELDLSCRDFDS